MTWIIVGFIVAGFVLAYVLWSTGGARAANPEWNVGDELANDGESGGFESDWSHYKQRKAEDTGPGWDS